MIIVITTLSKSNAKVCSMRNDDANNPSNEFSKFQLERKHPIAKLAQVEKKIARSPDRKVVPVTTTILSKEQQPSAVDRVGNFIFEGDKARALTHGMYKGKIASVIQIVHNKVSFKRPRNNKIRPSSRLSHNLLKLNKEEKLYKINGDRHSKCGKCCCSRNR